MNELAKLGDFSLDFMPEEEQRAPILRFKMGEYVCPPLHDDRNLVNGLLAVNLGSLRDTLTAWQDGTPHPVEEHEAYVLYGETLPTDGQLTSYPPRENGSSAWVEGKKIDAMLFVEGSDWQPVTLVAGTATAMIQMKTALKRCKGLARSYSPADWSPVWQMRGNNFYEHPKAGKVKIPLFEVVGMVKADGTTKALEQGFDMTPCETLGDRVPRPSGRKAGSAQPMIATGVVVPDKSASSAATMPRDVDDDIPF